MPLKHIVLTGAPVASSLCWDESELQDSNSGRHEAADEVRWRSLESVRGITTFTPPIDEGGCFFTAGAIERYSGDPVSGLETLSAFYEQSFAFHEGISSASFNDITRSFGDDDSTGLEESEGNSITLLPTADGDSHKNNNIKEAVRSSVSGHFSDLEGIPDAAYIHGLAPRIVTVNMIVAVITVEQRRRVRTRWGNAMDLIELLVGDETKSGFRISCWIAPRDEDQGRNKNPLEQALEGLRPCDIILLRSVALGTFQDQVYGQSLRNNTTRLDLLHRRPVDATDSEGLYPGRLLRDSTDDPQTAKAARVRSWTLDFIGPVRQVKRATALPPDSQ
ncbi:hypothetical protein MauCBS54593_004113 [Microsporum audouinii]